MANRKSWRRAVAPSPTPRPAPKHTPAFAGVADPALSNLLSSLVARDVLIRTIDGSEYTGLFSGTALSKATNPVLFLHLRFARASAGKFEPPVNSTDVRAGVARYLSLPVTHVAMLRATSPFTFSNNATSGFATDAQISRGAARPGRTLKKFDDFGDISGGSNKPLDEQTFGDFAVNGTGKWDQFQANHDKFGVTTTFNEDEYTTKIDRADANYEEREREAARLAEEIEARTSDNVHVREERNQDIGADYDEETLYSGVIRPEPSNPRSTASTGRSNSHSSQPSRSRPVANPTSGLRVTTQPTKEVPKETKRLSYAAATAGSMKNSATVAPVPSAASQSKQPTTASAASTSAAKPTLTGTTSSAKPVSPRSTPSPVSPPPHGQAQNKTTSSGKTGGGQKAVAQTKPVAPTKGAPPRAPAPAKNGSSAQSVPVPTNTTTKQKQSGSKQTNGNADTKEREVLDKKSKAAGQRDRSSRETLPQLVKVRSSITGRTSPNQSRNSPLPTPAATDTSAVAVLNLDAQTPNIGPEQIKNFEKYKTKREIQSIAQNREKITDDLRKFSTQLDSRNGPLRRANSNSNTSGANSGATNEKKVPETTAKIEEKPVATKEPEPKQTESKKTVPTVSTPSKAQSQDAAPKPKAKLKSKLNPNAQEFKMNPDAPSFTPSAQEQPPVNHSPQAYNPYTMGPVVPEYSQPVQSAPQPYPVPMQAMGQIPYGQAYGMLVPGGVPSGVGAPNPAYQFVPPGSFAPSQVAGRFPQNAGVPVSYGYGQMNPTMPMVMAPAPQRLPSGPYGYYNSGPYPGGQVAGGPQIPPPTQQQVLVPTNPGGAGVAHMQAGGMGMSGRSAHNGRRGGRRVGKHQSQHGVGGGNGVSSVEKGGQRMTENGMAAEAGQR